MLSSTHSTAPTLEEEVGPDPNVRTGRWPLRQEPSSSKDIFRDPDQPPYSGWEANTSGMFSIQILNSVAFAAYTGLRAPPTPISAHTYVENGIPFYTLYEEAPLRDPGAAIWQTIRSVTQIDRARAEDGTLRIAPHVSPSAAAAGCTACVLLLAAVADLAGRIVRPCNHAVCGTCWCALNGAAAAAPGQVWIHQSAVGICVPSVVSRQQERWRSPHRWGCGSQRSTWGMRSKMCNLCWQRPQKLDLERWWSYSQRLRLVLRLKDWTAWDAS